MSILKVVQAQPSPLPITVGTQPQGNAQTQPQESLQPPVRQGIMDALDQRPNMVQGSFNPLQGTGYEQQQPQVGVTGWNLDYLTRPRAVPTWQPIWNPGDFNQVHWGSSAPITAPPQAQRINGKVYMNGTHPSIIDTIKGLL